MSRIQKVTAFEILDSRGNPTVMVKIELDSGVSSTACVPSGASTGSREAVELRDGDPRRYKGKGVLKAVEHVNKVIGPALVGRPPQAQEEIDLVMRDLDGSATKSKLGANAILGVSMATCRAAASNRALPLYAYIRELHSGNEADSYVLPAPMMNVLNGGAHASNNMDFQEFMLFPIGAPTFSEALRYGTETFHSLKNLLHKRGLVTAVGDEGGFAPSFASNAYAVEFIIESIKDAGYEVGRQIALALDPAASEFHQKSHGYTLKKSDGSHLTSQQLIALWAAWAQEYPVVSLEDGMGEDDQEGWLALTKELGGKLQLVGDDNFVTNPKIFAEGVRRGIANAILIKLNQIGTVTETLETVAMAQKAGYGVIISHRSGETEDAFIADLAVGTGAGQIKTGSLCRSERVAKYNRLLAIEQELGERGRYGGPIFSQRWKIGTR